MFWRLFQSIKWRREWKEEVPKQASEEAQIIKANPHAGTETQFLIIKAH